MAAPRNENIKEKILTAAEELLSNEKMSDISLADIAKKAGVSKGTIYFLNFLVKKPVNPCIFSEKIRNITIFLHLSPISGLLIFCGL